MESSQLNSYSYGLLVSKKQGHSMRKRWSFDDTEMIGHPYAGKKNKLIS